MVDMLCRNPTLRMWSVAPTHAQQDVHNRMCTTKLGFETLFENVCLDGWSKIKVDWT